MTEIVLCGNKAYFEGKFVFCVSSLLIYEPVK